MNKAISFDDVLLVPKRTFGGSRGKVKLNTTICGHKMEIPIFSANMSSVTEAAMAVAMRRNGGLGVLHRMCGPSENIEMLREVYNTISEADLQHTPAFVSLPSSPYEAVNRVRDTADFAPLGYCIDVAHADSPDVEVCIVEILQEFPNIKLIIGNYATSRGIDNLLASLHKMNLLIDSFYERTAFKIGIGSGSQCTTRIVTGCGLPTLQSIFEIRKRFPDNDVKIIADGGFKNSGDIVKALAAGADAVMLGSLLAGTKEAPGNVIKDSGSLYKVYRGSASYGQKFEVGKDGYIEGEETLVPYKGHVATILTQLVEGIKSGMSYCGALNLEELRDNAEFMEITNAGHRESTAHGNS
jgi:IMP dehydrogenase